MIKYVLLSVLLLGSACSDSIEPTKVEGHKKQAFENNAVDAVGVAEGDEKISPFGKPAY